MMIIVLLQLTWIPIIVLAREFIVSGYRLLAVEKGGKVIAASIWGKLKTVTQMIAVILMFININNTNYNEDTNDMYASKNPAQYFDLTIPISV